jgi:hypothetical protein
VCERLLDLVGVLHRISGALESAEIPHELIDGLAVLVHVEEANPEHSVLTRDVDLMIRREDLNRVLAAAEASGFQFRHAAGVDMLLYGTTERRRNAVRLIFTGDACGRVKWFQIRRSLRSGSKYWAGKSS